MSFLTTLAGGGREALSALAEAAPVDPFGLVLLDWKMPGTDGFQVAEEIQGNPDRYGTPRLIMVTAYGREDAMRRADALNLNGFLIKPVTPSGLLDSIMQAFGKATAERGAGQTSVEGESSAAIRGAGILLVEDNEINQQVARELLQQAGLLVTVANNGQEAVDAAQKQAFDAILMDVQMPVMDGYEATRRIREWEKSGGRPPDAPTGWEGPFPIIAMTAHAMAGDAEKSHAAGMDDHVTKPINPGQLLAALAKRVKPRPGLGAAAREAGEDRPPAAEAPPKEPSAALPASLPGIDMADALNRVDGDRALFRGILLKIRAAYANARADIEKLLADGSNEDAQRLAHSIKGVAGNVGAKDLQAAAAEVEAVIKQGDAERIPGSLSAFDQALGVVVRGLEALGPARKAPTAAADAPEATGEQMREALQGLQPHLQARKPKPCKAAVAAVEALRWPEALANDVTELGKLVRKYKFREAQAIAEALLAELDEAPDARGKA
jgi:CheY-like chemotaxis protein/HPt (histidine-containing phosphotransfer) domain-containing protein